MSYEQPNQIGRYTIERLIGSGAMGNVFLGRDPDLDRQVAIKTVRDHGLDRTALETYLARFKNEARAAARLQHSNIVAVYDVGEDPNVGPYLVFEYIAGSSLKSILQSRGPLPPSQVLSLGEQVARAIDAAHDASILHRDIKPDNVLVTEEGRAKLADFGIARLPDAALTREGQFLGTPCYAAPETLTKGEYSATSDLFSFAAMLYEFVTGTRAFPGDDAMAVAHAVVSESPVPPSRAASGVRISSEIDDVLLRALSKPASERYPTASDIMRALRAAYVRSGDIEATASDALSTISTPAARSNGATTTTKPRHLASWVGIVVVLGVVLGVALIFLLARERSVRFVFPGSLAQDADAGEPLANATTEGEARIRVLDAGTDGGDGGPFASDVPTVVVVTVLDAAVPAVPDAAAPPLPTSPRLREEAAKDAIAQAREAVEAGRLEEARSLLSRARELDPGNSDIADVEHLLAAPAPVETP